ncbi:TlpA disulfide reductase family protein [Bartonella grahamii]|uniref:Cytochrome c biogenesis protein tlpA n=2 Tax=Bartonella grahamii TaxID=33045 RepID=A0A336NG56_BARGR|nr:TlpA disulfide reductase family protein [Bartonella grahamii]ACS52067.1 thiol:disulfide interchange protein [Bartonella grahamii as4aup]SSZ39671.1 Cytochrome c biogenesis protein tlpA [Bartonella grahamii]
MISQIFISEKNNKKRQFSLAFFIIALSLYATTNYDNKRESFLFNFISAAKAQKINIDKTREEKMMAIRKAAKGFFSHVRFSDTPSDMKKLSFKDIQGKEHTLSEFTGKPMLVNLWAIWCAPCRTEMPELAQLKHELGRENFDVIAINIDKTASPEKIQQFLQNIHADNLLYYRDETMDIFNNVRKQGLALGLPITFLIDKEGYLIASFNGAAPWANDDAKALIKAVIKEAL